MSIKDRLRRLEGAAAEHCRECRLRPASIHAIYPGEEDSPIPEPEHCPKCGRLIETHLLRIVYDR
jgi:hypothetical protein